MCFYSEATWVDWIDRLAENDFLAIDSFLPEELYLEIQRFFKSGLADFHQAGIGSAIHHQIDQAIRGDYIFWLDKNRDQIILPFFKLVEELIENLNRFCFLSLSGYEFHLAHYPPGTFYKKHLDQFKERSNRMISVIIYLNEDWKSYDGGELKIYKGEEELLIEPLANRCVIFKSAEVPHEVMMTNVSRNSLTGWLLYQPASLGYMLT